MNTRFAGVPLTGRGVGGWEGVRLPFNSWSDFIGNFGYIGFFQADEMDEVGQMNLPAS